MVGDQGFRKRPVNGDAAGGILEIDGDGLETAEDVVKDRVDVTIGVEVERATGKDDEEAETSPTDGGGGEGNFSSING